jgi:hypothetical protein
MPGARCTRGLIRKWRRARMSIRAQRRHPASPAQRLYGLWRALPGDEFVLSPSSTDASDTSTRSGQRVTADLAPATGVRTTRFCRTLETSFVLRAFSIAHRFFENQPCDPFARRRSRVHHIPSRVRDDRDTPLLPERDGDLKPLIWGRCEAQSCPSCHCAATRRATGLSLVIPGRAKHEPGIHWAALIGVGWIPGSRRSASRPGMTRERLAQEARPGLTRERLEPI